MKALSIREPWASLIVDGHKDIEIRVWGKASITKAQHHLHERIAIHASKTYQGNVADHLQSVGKPVVSPEDASLGCIIGTVRLVDVRIYATALSFNKDAIRHLNGYLGQTFFEQMDLDKLLVGLVFQEGKRIAPAPVKGRLGFFEVEEEEGVEG